MLIDTNGIPVDYLPTQYTNSVVYIVAGTYREAVRFAQSKQLHRGNWIYVYQSMQLRGIHSATVYLTGTYAELDDWLGIFKHLMEKGDGLRVLVR